MTLPRIADGPGDCNVACYAAGLHRGNKQDLLFVAEARRSAHASLTVIIAMRPEDFKGGPESRTAVLRLILHRTGTDGYMISDHAIWYKRPGAALLPPRTSDRSIEPALVGTIGPS